MQPSNPSPNSQANLDGSPKCGTCAYHHAERLSRALPPDFCTIWGCVRLPQYNACDLHTPANEPEHP